MFEANSLIQTVTVRVLLSFNQLDKRPVRVFHKRDKRTFRAGLKWFIRYGDFRVPHRLHCLIHIVDFEGKVVEHAIFIIGLAEPFLVAIKR